MTDNALMRLWIAAALVMVAVRWIVLLFS